MITAQEAFELTQSRSQKVKEEKLALVESKIKEAVEKELLSTTFSFISLKPFVGSVIEELTKHGFKISQSATNVVVSWDLSKKTTPVVSVVHDEGSEPEVEDDEYYNDTEEDDFDGGDYHNI